MTTMLALLLLTQPGPEEREIARFLTLAVFEGLFEDGAEAELVQALAKDEPLYVRKCPICVPVQHAFRILAAAPPPYKLWDGRGAGLPKELAAQLWSTDLTTRKRGLEALVKRYVDRRFERLKMSDDEKTRLRSLLEKGHKTGTRYASLPPGDFCPSCDGAAKR